MLERLAVQAYYCFLDGYFGYNQIVVDPKDQEKTTFTCPFDVFTYIRISFGLWNAPTTFQRCMLAIFLDLEEKCIEVFMNDFFVLEACLVCACPILKLCWKGVLRQISFSIGRNAILWWLKGLFLVTKYHQGALRWIKLKRMLLKRYLHQWMSKELEFFLVMQAFIDASSKTSQR